MAKTGNRKLVVAVVVLSVVLMALIGGMIAVYAAMQQNVTTSFSVGYTAGENVAAAVGANWRKGDNQDDVHWFTHSGKAYKTYLAQLDAFAPDAKLSLEGDNDLIAGYTTVYWVSFYVENLRDDASINVTFKDGAVTNPESIGFEIAYFGSIVPDINTVAMFGSSDPTFNPTIELNDNKEYSFTVPALQIYCITLIINLKYEYINTPSKYISNENGGISFVIEKA